MTIDTIMQHELVITHDPDEHEHDLATFFRESYGEDYRGDENLAKKIREADHLVVLRHSTAETLGAVALLARGRIATVATSSDRELFGRRSLLMLDLLNACHDSGAARWISIGTTYERMQDVASEAGMRALSDIETAEKILSSINEVDKYRRRLDGQGNVVLSSNLPNGKLYEQHLWAWPLAATQAP